MAAIQQPSEAAAHRSNACRPRILQLDTPTSQQYVIYLGISTKLCVSTGFERLKRRFTRRSEVGDRPDRKTWRAFHWWASRRSFREV